METRAYPTKDYGEVLIGNSIREHRDKDYFETEFGKFNSQRTVWHKIPQVKKIIYNGLNQKILFERGEINLSINNGWLNVYSTNYYDSTKKVIFTKEILPDYSPFSALSNAKNSILDSIEKNYESQRKAMEDSLQGKFSQKKITPSVKNSNNIQDISFFLAMNGVDEFKMAGNL